MKIIRAAELEKMYRNGGVSWDMIVAGGREQIQEYLKAWANRARSSDEPTIHDNIEFWTVGRNASHEFYAGVDAEGKLYSCAGGEEVREGAEFPILPDDPEDEEAWLAYLNAESDIMEWRESPIREVLDFNGYYGHF